MKGSELVSLIVMPIILYRLISWIKRNNTNNDKWQETETTIKKATYLESNIYKTDSIQLKDNVTKNETDFSYSSIKEIEDGIKTGTLDIKKTYEHGLTALHYAAKEDKLLYAKYLVDRGSDVESQDLSLATPIHYAAKYNSLRVMSYLIFNGVNILVKDKSNKTPLDYAQSNNSVDAAQYLINSNKPFLIRQKRTKSQRTNNNIKTRVKVLASSSSGNATLITRGNNSIMVDCGIGRDYLNLIIDHRNNFIENLKGVVITHSHIDHAGGSALNKILKKNVPVYCHIENIDYLLRKKNWHIGTAHRMGLLRTFKDNPFKVGGFFIKHFQVEHDAEGYNCGFSILTQDKKKITIATDLGFFDNKLIKHFTNSDIIIIESNYDYNMLINSKREEQLKERIQENHLSNKDCAKAINRIVGCSINKPKHIFLSHISTECNSEQKAYDEVSNELNKNKNHRIKLLISHKSRPSEEAII